MQHNQSNQEAVLIKCDPLDVSKSKQEIYLHINSLISFFNGTEKLQEVDYIFFNAVVEELVAGKKHNLDACKFSPVSLFTSYCLQITDPHGFAINDVDGGEKHSIPLSFESLTQCLRDVGMGKITDQVFGQNFTSQLLALFNVPEEQLVLVNGPY